MGYGNGMPTTATSYDGTERDISRFYEDKQFNYTIDIAAKRADTTYILGYDNGISTAKYSRSGSLRAGINHTFRLSKRSTIDLFGWRQWVGSVNEVPCTDSYNRQYYCGNLTAWSDYQGGSIEDSYKARATYKYRF